MPSFANPNASFFCETYGGPVMLVESPLSGSTIRMGFGDRLLFVNASLVPALVIYLPPGVEAGELVEIAFETGVSALTVLDAAGDPIESAPVAAVGPGAAIHMRYISRDYGWVVWDGAGGGAGGGAGIHISDAAPVDAVEGQLWFDSATADMLYVFFDGAWVPAVNQPGGSGGGGGGDGDFLPLTGGTVSGVITSTYTGSPSGLTLDSSAKIELGVDTSWGDMGDPAMLVSLDGGRNGIVGYVYMDAAPVTVSFPAGVNGYGKLAATSTGNTVFGMFALAELYPAGGGMAVGQEITTHNYGGTPDTALPPTLTFGTTTRVANGLQITAGGDYDSSIGLMIANEGGGTKQFNTAAYLWAFRQYGLYIDAQAAGTQYNIVSRSNGNGANLVLKTTTTAQPLNKVLTVRDSADAEMFSVQQSGAVIAANSITSQFGAIFTQGTNAAYSFADRNGTSADWLLYANADLARVARVGSGDALTVSAFGALTTTGKITAPASAAAQASLNLPHGTAPSTPVNGDLWTTTGGLFAQVNGATVGPYGTGGGSTGLSGMVSGQIPIAASGTTVTSSANLSGDVTSNATLVTTLATVNANVGIFQGLTVNGKGLVTAAVNQNYLTSVTAASTYLPLSGGTLTGTLTGTTMAGTLFWLLGTGTFAVSDGLNAGYTKIFDNSGTESIWLGNGGSQMYNLYSQSVHQFQSRVGDGYVRIDSGGLTMLAGKATTLASTTSAASLTLPPGTAPTSPVNGDIWTTSAGLFARINGTTVGPYTPPKYIVSAFVPGVPTASQTLLIHRVSKAITIPANFAAYLGYASTAGGSVNATASTVITVAKAVSATPTSFSTVGTITFAAGSVTPTFATSGGTTVAFAQGDVIRLTAPASPDASFSDFYCSLAAGET